MASSTLRSFHSSVYGCVENQGCSVCYSAGVIKVNDQHSHGRCRADAWLCAEEIHLHLHGISVQLPKGACNRQQAPSREEQAGKGEQL